MVHTTKPAAIAVFLLTRIAAADPPTASFEPIAETRTAAAFPVDPPPEPPPLPLTNMEAPPPTSSMRWEPAPSRPPIAARRATPDEDSESSSREDWLLSIEAVSRAPIDVGGQSILETPFGLRIGGGYSWMPTPYLELLGNAAHLASASELSPRFASGRILRGSVGLRPFRSFGAYFDLGYGRASIDGTVAAPEVTTNEYAFSSDLELWFAELGYQSSIGDRVVLAFGIGITGVLDAETDAGERDPAVAEAARTVDATLEQYGYVPTLTLRLGLDLI